MNFVSNKH